MLKLRLQQLLIITTLAFVGYVVVFLLTKPDREMLDIVLAIFIVIGQIPNSRIFYKALKGEQYDDCN